MAAQQPSQEELQAYLEQLREAEPAEIVAQAFQILAMGAEVKIGRPDARLLIDAVDAMSSAVGARLPGQLAEGMRSAVGQLQSMQVQAERTATGDAGAAAAQQTDATQGRPDAPPASPPPPQRGQPQGGQPEGGQGQGGQSMTDRLWVPGR